MFSRCTDRRPGRARARSTPIFVVSILWTRSRRSPRPRPGSSSPTSCPEPARVAFSGGRRDQHRELAARRGRGQAGQVLRRRRSHDLLVLLGELAAQNQPDLAEDLADRRHRGHDAMGRFIEHDGRAHLPERLEAVESLAGLDRQEPVEDEAVGGQARGREGGDDRAGTRHGNDRGALSPRLTNQQDARIRDPRRARVGDERDRAPRRQIAQELRTPRELVVLVVAHGGLVDVEVRQEGARPPRVLAGHQVDLAQHSQRAQSNVLEVADRSRYDKKNAAQAVCSFASETRIGLSRFRMTSRVITHSLSPWIEGRSYMISSMTSSRIARRPRAPVPRLSASRAIAATASSVNLSRTFSRSKYFWYCLMIAFLGSRRMRTSAWSSRSCRVAITGRRPTNSGMSPYFKRSSGWIIASRSPTRLSSRLLISAPKPMPERPTRLSMILSRPTKAPPHRKSTLEVSTWMNSWCGCLRPPWGGTLATVPSRIFKSACCTPSPETSRVIDGFSDLRAILSISSI